MMKIGNEVRFPAAPSRARFPFTTRLAGLIILALSMTLGTLRAEEPSEQYLRVYNLMTQADTLSASNEIAAAKAKYEAAQKELFDLKQTYPTWNPKLVAYRLGYLADKIAALSQAAASANQETSPARQREARANPSAGSASTPQIRLLDAGSEPRQVLRLHPQVGSSQSLAVTLQISMDMQLGGAGGQSMKIPTITLPIDVTVQDVSSNGDITYQTVVGQPDVAVQADTVPQMAEAMKTAFAALKGLSTRGTKSDRGVGKGTEMKLPAGADPQVGQTMDQMGDILSSFSGILPEEAVGPGARWEIRQPLVSQGMKINQTVTYQLVSIEGDQFNAKLTLTQQAANQKIQNPSMPAMKIDVTKMTGAGSGDISFDLTRLMPTRATIDTHSDVSMQMDAGGRKQAMQMKQNFEIHVESK